MAKRAALGKGLDALMGGGYSGVQRDDELRNSRQEAVEDSAAADSPATSPADVEDAGASRAERPTAESSEAPGFVSVDLIDENPYQPRKQFNDEQLGELADTIAKMGVITALTVRKEGNRYQLIAGERRLRAAKLAGLRQVPVVVLEVGENEMIEMALVENIQRTDLNPIEIAESLEQLSQTAGLTHDELAPRVGKSRPTITNYLRLLRLPEKVKEQVRGGLISMAHAKLLLSVEDLELLQSVADRIAEEHLTVAEVERLLRASMAKKGAPDLAAEAVDASSEGSPDAYLPAMQSALEQRLGYGVQVKPGKHGSGRVVIQYRSEGERQELLRKLGIE